MRSWAAIAFSIIACGGGEEADCFDSCYDAMAPTYKNLEAACYARAQSKTLTAYSECLALGGDNVIGEFGEVCGAPVLAYLHCIAGKEHYDVARTRELKEKYFSYEVTGCELEEICKP